MLIDDVNWQNSVSPEFAIHVGDKINACGGVNRRNK